MLLHDYFRSSAAFRVRIALNLKGLAYARRDVSLLDGEQRSAGHLALNPQGFVPALEAEGTVLTQSLAIIDWLDTRHPEPRLIPAEPVARAHALAQAMVIACDIHPLNNLRVRQRLAAMGLDEAVRNEWQRHWIAEGFAALEAMAGAGPFLGGEAPGIADIFLVPQAYNARRLDMTLDDWPKLARAEAAATALEPFAAASPERTKP